MLKLLHRMLIVIGLLLAFLTAVIAVIIAVDNRGAQERLAAVTNTSIAIAGGSEIRAYVARPAKAGPHPTIILLHEFWGIGPDIVAKADALAAQGYLVVAPNLFRERNSHNPLAATMNWFITPFAQQLDDVDTVYRWAAAQHDVQPGRVALVGFSYGGQMALDYGVRYATKSPVVTFYGFLSSNYPLSFAAMRGPVLGIFASEDVSIVRSSVREFEDRLNTAGVINEITVYEGQSEGFMTNIDAIRSGGAQGKAWDQMLRFLKKHLARSES